MSYQKFQELKAEWTMKNKPHAESLEPSRTGWEIEPRKFCISIMLGLACFVGSFFTLNFSFPPFFISINWFDFLPLLASMAFGGRYGFIASTLGLGVLYPFILWPNNGWANLVTSILFICLHTVIGYLRGLRNRRSAFWNHPMLVWPLSVFLFCLSMRVTFPMVLALNPPFWNPQAELSMPTPILDAIVIKSFVFLFVVVVFVDYLLKLPLLRKILGLAIRKESSQNGRIAWVAFLGSAAVWLMFNLLNCTLLEHSFPHGLFQVNDPHELIALIGALSSGIFAGSIFVEFAESRLRAEDSLHASQGRLKRATSAGNIGIWDWDIVANELLWDESMYSLYGIHAEDFTGAYEAWSRTLHPDDRSFAEGEIQAAIQGVREYTCEFRVVRPDGTTRVIKAAAQTLRDEDGRAVRMIGTNVDITQQKLEGEEKLRLQNHLAQAQRMESVGVLAGGIAHDFNNLMSGIYGYIELASAETDPDKIASYLSRATQTLERSRALTTQLLTFAKGGAPIQKIGHLFPFIQETAQFALSGANVACRFEIPRDLWSCNFDRNQIGQVIDNLIINAQQAMPMGGTIEMTARNTVLAEQELPPLVKGNYVKISVTDHGSGISPEMIGHIFEPFFTTKAKGHGLGLAICYSIVNRHGGCINVESELGKGSSFHLYLPASSEAVSSSLRKSAIEHHGSGTFLVMDDEIVVQKITSAMLKSLGYEPVCKDNGKDAIDFVRAETQASRPIVGMIFDLTVPGGMGGRAANEEIRKMDTGIPAFVASGYAEDPIMKNPAAYGFRASIAKPFKKGELMEMLETHLSHAKS
jgi:PAS domain S-box-containing protein